MSWVPSKRRFAQFALLAMMTGEASYLAAEVLILRSSGPSARQYRPGQRLADDARMTLRPGDTVVILAGRGTRTMRGPGTFAAGAPLRVGGLASLSGPTRRRVREQTGAVRGPGDLPATAVPSSIWQFNIGTSGRACVPAGQMPVLWRRDAAQAVQLTITPPSGAPQTVDWPAGQATLAWPGSVAVAGGATYQLIWTGADYPVRITTEELPALPEENLEAIATAFLDRGCRSQLDVLIATRAEPQGGGATGSAAVPVTSSR